MTLTETHLEPYHAEHDKLQQMRLKRNGVESAISDRLAALADARDRRESGLDDDAERLLAGESLDPRLAALDRVHPLETLYRERRVLSHAIRKQERRVLQAQFDVSQAVCEELRPEYRELAKAKVAALVALCEAEQADREFLDALHEADIRFASHLTVTRAKGMRFFDGNRPDPDSAASLMIRNYLTDGLLTPRELIALGVPKPLIEVFCEMLQLSR